MIETTAVVSKIAANQVWVRTEQQSNCGHCSEQGSCSTQLLAQYGTRRELPIDTDLLLKQGDKIIIAIDENQLLKSSFICYMIPLLALFLGALLGGNMAKFWPLFNADLVLSMSAIACFSSTLLLINKWQVIGLTQQAAKPIVLRRLN